MNWISYFLEGHFRIFQTFYLMIHMLHYSSAGVCWMAIDPLTKSCREAYSLNMTKQECCNISSVTSVSWTPEEHISRSRLFLLNFLGGDELKCQRCHNTCDTVRCNEGKVCRMKYGVPECLCKPHCEKKMKDLGPFCGTDGRKYKHYCSLLRRNCMYHQQVNISYLGKCRKSCKHVECFNGNHCLQDQNGIPHCVSCHDKCPFQIPDNSDNYICGSDGQTYKNTCELKAAICQKGASIRIAYEGACRKNHACSNIYCSDHKKCLLDVRTRTPVCTDCTRICLSSIYIPICGTDGRTYDSYCHMQMVSCKRGIVIKTRRAGACKGHSYSVKSKKKGRRIRHRKIFRERQKIEETNETDRRKRYSHNKALQEGKSDALYNTKRKRKRKSNSSRRRKRRQGNNKDFRRDKDESQENILNSDTYRQV